MAKNKDGFDAGQELTFEQVRESLRIAKSKAEKKTSPKSKAG